MRNNVTATQHLLEAVRVAPDCRVVYASSSSVYGQAETLPTPEDVVPHPVRFMDRRIAWMDRAIGSLRC